MRKQACRISAADVGVGTDEPTLFDVRDVAGRRNNSIRILRVPDAPEGGEIATVFVDREHVVSAQDVDPQARLSSG